MLLTNPIWLWALAGLSIPIGIHLLSRKEGQVILIGSLRHLEETNTQQFKGIRLNEIVLLMLRCALIILLVLLMSGLSFERTTKSETQWVLIEKGLENLPDVRTQLDTFKNHGYELRWLADGFPLYEDSASVSSSKRYWKLTEQLQSQKISDVISFSRSRIDGFKGKRPSQPSNIRWISVPSGSSDFILRANTLNDSIVVRTGKTSAALTQFTTQVHSKNDWNQSTRPPSMDSVKIVIVSDNLHQYDRKIVEASLEAIKASNLSKLEVVNSSPEKINSTGYENWCIWLSDQPVSDSVAANIIYLRPELNAEILIQEKINRWVITKRLNEEIGWNENLTVKLASILFSSESDWRVATQNDKRMLSDESIWSNNNSEDASNASLLVQSADFYLLIVFLVTLLLERILAYYRNQ